MRKPGAFARYRFREQLFPTMHFRLAYAAVRDLAEPKVPEAPLLTLSGKPDLKIYDRLLTVSLAAVGVCA